VPVSNWLPYAIVASADRVAERAAAAGTWTLFPPMEVPGGDRIAVMMDLQGAVCAVHSTRG
jgi:predicted enzyme related to lactoylglutathione lyase